MLTAERGSSPGRPVCYAGSELLVLVFEKDHTNLRLPILKSSVIYLEWIRAAYSDFEARRLLRQSARHRRESAPGTGPMLVPSLQRYQACPLSKPGIYLCTPDFLSRSVRYYSIPHRIDRTVFSGPN